MSCAICGKHPSVLTKCKSCKDNEIYALSMIRTAIKDLEDAVERVKTEGVTSYVATLCNSAAGRARKITDDWERGQDA